MPPARQRIVQIDAFSERPFAGNPAAVCLMDGPAPADWMQAVAAEMNLSETAFLHPADDGYALRWFTPGAEVDLCGHATLASAHLLWEDRHLAADATARFATRSGTLTAVRDGDWIVLDFPALEAAEAAVPEGLAAALGATPVAAAQSRYDLLVLLESEEAVRGLAPDFGALRRFAERGVIATAAAETAGFDFVSRFFAPAVRVDEDPVTGSAHCVLAPYWADRLGRPRLTGWQASRRGGTVRVEVREGGRVGLGGQAVTVMEGHLR